MTGKIERQAAADDHVSAGAHRPDTGFDLHLGSVGGQWPKIDNPSAAGDDQLLEHYGLELRATVEQLGEPFVGLDKAPSAGSRWQRWD